jgi:ABC-type transport system substrate-binding protein
VVYEQDEEETMRLSRVSAAALLVVLAACTSGGTTTQPAESTTVTTAATTTSTTVPAEETTFSFGIVEPTGIDPGLTADTYGFHVNRVVFDGLTDISPELEVVGAVAESWTTTDNMTWVFHLRDDSYFSDGRAVTAADFVFGWNRAADPDNASPVAYHGLPIAGWAEVMDGTAETISGVRAIDDLTLEVTTSQPFGLLPKVLAHGIFSPVPAEYLDTAEKAAAFGDQPIGNGPYALAGPWEHNVGISLVRNQYHSTPGGADRIEVRIYSDNEAMFRDVQGGNLDIGYQAVTPGLLSTAQSEFGDRLLQVPVGAVTYLTFPVQAEPYDNPDLRRALSMAIDREAIVDRIWSGTVVTASGLVPPQAEGAVSDGCPFCELNTTEALELYQSSGGLPDDRTKIYYEPSLAQGDVEAIANNWRTNLGVETELIAMEFDPLVELLYSGWSDGLVAIGWIWDYPSAYSFLSPLLESTSGDNTGLWANEGFDSLMEQARTAPDETAGIPFLEEAQRIFGDEMPLLPLYFATDLSVYSDRVSNVLETAHGFVYLELVQVTG